MHHLLSSILEKKKKEIELLKKARQEKNNFSNFRPNIEPNAFLPNLQRDREHLKVIAEYKRKSPSSGIISHTKPVAEVTETYKQCGASALSILTDTEFFLGNVQDLQIAKKTKLPILRKDFVLSPLQIDEAAEKGADAVLLIVRILSPDLLNELSARAKELGLATLMEVHNLKEVEIALEHGAQVIGINHRDLDTLSIDLNISKRLSPIIRKKDENIVIIGESGIHTRQDRKQIENFVDAVLIGTSLMASEDIPKQWESIFGES